MVAKQGQRSSSQILDRQTFASGLRSLARRDPDLARVIRTYGRPPLWSRRPGFPTLVHIILEQQVSLSSAQAAFRRLTAAVSPLTPEGFLELNDAELKGIGFSRQKTGYGRGLAGAILEGRLNLRKLSRLDDGRARKELLDIKGIGIWTADIYLLIALRRPDVWPRGDLALVSAVKDVKQLRTNPTPQRWDRIGEPWRPWRAVASRVLWHFYLRKRGLF